MVLIAWSSHAPHLLILDTTALAILPAQPLLIGYWVRNVKACAHKLYLATLIGVQLNYVLLQAAHLLVLVWYGGMYR